jgi:hypothetical protein
LEAGQLALQHVPVAKPFGYLQQLFVHDRAERAE